MSARLVYRVSWPLVIVSLMGVGWLVSPVRSQDDNGVISAETDEANVVLQAVGGLGVGHIQSTLGLIGVTADAFAKEVYSPKQVEDLMNGTINGIEAVKKLLRKLQDTPLSDDDEEYIDRMVTVYNALQREAKALTVFAKSKKARDAEVFEKARQSAVMKLNQLTDGSPVKGSDPPADTSGVE